MRKINIINLLTHKVNMGVFLSLILQIQDIFNLLKDKRSTMMICKAYAHLKYNESEHDNFYYYDRKYKFMQVWLKENLKK